MSSVRTKQRGAVALFIVVFAALLITTITVAFVRIMTQNQNQASTIDLSKSALDSAFAGVEDAKRAIVECENSTDPSDDPVCLALKEENVGCRTIQEAGIASGEKEVLIKQQTAGTVSDKDKDEALEQAYTCVKIIKDAPNYLQRLESTNSRLVHLKGVSTFDRVVIEWFSEEDQRDSGSSSLNLGNSSGLLPLGNWPNNRPPMIRAQLIQYDRNSFKVTDFDNSDTSKTNNASLFLMPSSLNPPASLSFVDDQRRSRNAQPVLIKCESASYACEAEIEVPGLLNGSTSRKDAYLLISKIYGGNVDFRVTLKDGGSSVNFNGVQYIVDSTGRANDLFRRVQSRVELGDSDIPFPEAAVDLAGRLCKKWELTDTTGRDRC